MADSGPPGMVIEQICAIGVLPAISRTSGSLPLRRSSP